MRVRAPLTGVGAGRALRLKENSCSRDGRAGTDAASTGGTSGGICAAGRGSGTTSTSSSSDWCGESSWVGGAASGLESRGAAGGDASSFGRDCGASTELSDDADCGPADGEAAEERAPLDPASRLGCVGGDEARGVALGVAAESAVSVSTGMKRSDRGGQTLAGSPAAVMLPNSAGACCMLALC